MKIKEVHLPKPSIEITQEDLSKGIDHIKKKSVETRVELSLTPREAAVLSYICGFGVSGSGWNDIRRFTTELYGKTKHHLSLISHPFQEQEKKNVSLIFPSHPQFKDYQPGE